MSNQSNGQEIFAQSLIDFIDECPTPFHTIKTIKNYLKPFGYKELKFDEQWTIKSGEKYFVTENNTAIIAFNVGLGEITEHGFHIVAAHTDSPGFRLKPFPEIHYENKYIKLNIETYGSPIINTWLDRPLSIAGRIVIKGKSIYYPDIRLFNSNQPLLVIPNLPIHLNQKINEGIELNKQKDIMPLLSMISESVDSNSLTFLIAKEFNIEPEDILDFDLFLYENKPGTLTGLNKEFISSGRLDDLAMVHAGMISLSENTDSMATNMLACFDNEECGSLSKQGAASPLIKNVLERISLSLNKNKEDYYRAIARSFLISADMAHALHPNSPEKYDPVNKPIINAGPVIKINANQNYTSDGVSSAIFDSLCQHSGVSVQRFVNRSDMRGGTTLGPILTSHLTIKSVDIGSPLLAMHSIRELAGTKDHMEIKKVFSVFFS